MNKVPIITSKIRFKGERIVWYIKKPSQDYWSKHWKKVSVESVMDGPKRSTILHDVFVNYLSAQDAVLDGGCGLGQWVKMLGAEGYNPVGVDGSLITLKSAKNYDANLPLITGDCLSFPFPSNCFDGYVSLGVVEHFVKGPEIAINEAYRVLKAGGLLFVSVPYFNFLRKMKKALHLYKDEKLHSDDEFYQYAFTTEEFSRILKKCGFTLLDVVPYDPVKCLKDDFSVIDRIYRKLEGKLLDQQFEHQNYRTNTNNSGDKGITKSIVKTMFNSGLLRKTAAHMVLFVAQASKE